MSIVTVDFTITIPVNIFIVSRQKVVFLVYIIAPDIFPTFISAGSLISELYSLITVVQIVIAPFLI